MTFALIEYFSLQIRVYFIVKYVSLEIRVYLIIASLLCPFETSLLPIFLVEISLILSPNSF